MFQTHNLPQALAVRILRSCLKVIDLWISHLPHPSDFTQHRFPLDFLQGEVTWDKFVTMNFDELWYNLCLIGLSVSWSKCPWNTRRLQSYTAIIPLWNKITPEKALP